MEKKQKKILVVDVKSDGRQFLVDLLIKNGYEVITSDATLSPCILSTFEFNLIIVDGNVDPLRVDDGVEWARSVCTLVPVVVYSLTKYSSIDGPGIKYIDKIDFGDLLKYISKM
jgi:DNA-binding response OmpR family regulator